VGELPYISVVKPAFVDPGWRYFTNYEEVLAGLSCKVVNRYNLFYVEICTIV